METVYFLGIDMAKKTFDAALTTDGNTMYHQQVENQPKGIKAFFLALQKKFSFSFEQLVVCVEHTGIYCLPLLDYLVKTGIRVAVEPPLQIKHSQGMTRGKTDKIDAARIAQYAVKNLRSLRFWKPQRKEIQNLQVLLTTRERLIKIKVQLQTPIAECSEYLDKDLRKQIEKNCKSSLRAILQDLLKIEKSIAALISKDERIREQVRLATSVPGVGKITALSMLIASGEYERISDHKKFACYSGVAPFQHTSGTTIRGKTRVSPLANMTIKRLLHLAAMSGIQCSQELKVYYQRKVSEGKNKMSVINAVRNKLISRVFVCIKNKHMYEKNYRAALA